MKIFYMELLIAIPLITSIMVTWFHRDWRIYTKESECGTGYVVARWNVRFKVIDFLHGLIALIVIGGMEWYALYYYNSLGLDIYENDILELMSGLVIGLVIGLVVYNPKRDKDYFDKESNYISIPSGCDESLTWLWYVVLALICIIGLPVIHSSAEYALMR